MKNNKKYIKKSKIIAKMIMGLLCISYFNTSFSYAKTEIYSLAKEIEKIGGKIYSQNKEVCTKIKYALPYSYNYTYESQIVICDGVVYKTDKAKVYKKLTEEDKKKLEKYFDLKNKKEIIVVDLLCPFCEKYIKEKFNKIKENGEIGIILVGVHQNAKKATNYILNLCKTGNKINIDCLKNKVLEYEKLSPKEKLSKIEKWNKAGEKQKDLENQITKVLIDMKVLGTPSVISLKEGRIYLGVK